MGEGGGECGAVEIGKEVFLYNKIIDVISDGSTT